MSKIKHSGGYQVSGILPKINVRETYTVTEHVKVEYEWRGATRKVVKARTEEEKNLPKVGQKYPDNLVLEIRKLHLKGVKPSTLHQMVEDAGYPCKKTTISGLLSYSSRINLYPFDLDRTYYQFEPKKT